MKQPAITRSEFAIGGTTFQEDIFVAPGKTIKLHPDLQVL